MVFVAGSAFLSGAQIVQTHFVAVPADLAWCGGALVALGLGLRRRTATPRGAAAPAPWVVCLAAFAATSAHWCRDFLPGVVPQWTAAAGWFVLAGASAVVWARWSRRPGWGAAHRLALAGGALLTYVWVGVTQAPYLHVSRVTALTGNLVFGLGAVALLALAARSVRGREALA